MSEAIHEVLREVVREAAGKLREISDEEARRRPAEGKWSKKEILGHLIDSAANNHQRFVRAQLASELGIPTYDQNGWVRCQNYQEADWKMLVDVWIAYNELLAHVIANIDEREWPTLCRIGDGEPVTLGFVVNDYLRHLNHHLRRLGCSVEA